MGGNLAMIRLAFLVAGLFLLQGCIIRAGLAVHPVRTDKPEYDEPNPLGVIRFESDDRTFFCEHISSIPKTEQGYGLNMCGFMTDL